MSYVPRFSLGVKTEQQTQGGDLNSTTTRFWLALVPEQAAQLLHQFLISELGEHQVKVQSLPDKIIMYVQKAAGQKTVEGSFVIRSNDSIQAEGQTLVVMYRRKVSPWDSTVNRNID
jgi:serine/threonine-protein kinase Chk1